VIEKVFSSGEIGRIVYDPPSRCLQLEWRNKRFVAHRPVPEEVFRRLCNSPNRLTYYEDRIAEEYPKTQATSAIDANVSKHLDDLFGC
jgi:hypothetical protein